MDFMDTSELGAGMNPTADEEYKTFQFEFNGSNKGYGVVTARTYEEAKELIENGDYDEIIETYGEKIEEITKIEEE